jgi:hypothetical protein
MERNYLPFVNVIGVPRLVLLVGGRHLEGSVVVRWGCASLDGASKKFRRRISRTGTGGTRT